MNPQVLLLLKAEPVGRVFGLDLQTLIQIGIQLLNAGVLAAVLALVLYNPVRNFLQKRADKIKSQLDRAAEDMAKANELKLQYDQKLTDIELERNEILESARRLADEKAAHILDEAKNEANAVKERAAADIALERERVNDEMKKVILEVSCIMAGKFVAHAIDAETQDTLFASTMAELEETSWQN